MMHNVEKFPSIIYRRNQYRDVDIPRYFLAFSAGNSSRVCPLGLSGERNMPRAGRTLKPLWKPQWITVGTCVLFKHAINYRNTAVF